MVGSGAFLAVAWPTGFFNCWFSFAPVFQWCCSTPPGTPGVGVGQNTLFLLSPHLCFIIVFICDLFVSRDDPLMGYKTFTRTEQLYVLSHYRSRGRGWDPVKPAKAPPASILILTVPRRYVCYDSLLLIVLAVRVIWTSFWFISVFESTAYLKFAKLQYVSSGFRCRVITGHWWGFISLNYVVWPTFFLINVFIALKGFHFWFLFNFTAAGVVPCGGRKTSPRTSTIVQSIFYFGPLWSAIIFWEIKYKWLVQTHILDRFLIIWTSFWFISVFESTAYLKFAKLQYDSSGFHCRVITGSLMRFY